MSCGDVKQNQNQDCGCLADILKKILLLQRQDYDNENYKGCDKPYLGPICNTICYNTRPIMLFNCCTGAPWSFTYTINNQTSTSDVFRIEAIDDCCCTCRILYLDTATNRYLGTSEFFTINLDCVGALRCLPDTFIDLC